MSKIPLHPKTRSALDVGPAFTGANPLPTLLQTPSGLALLELQGTINLPAHDDEDAIAVEGAVKETPIGRLVFPDFEEGMQGQGWMKRVYLYVGQHQRLTGEVKKLPKAVAVIRRRTAESGELLERQDGEEELEIVEIVKFKIIFSTRPEPVGTLPVSSVS